MYLPESEVKMFRRIHQILCSGPIFGAVLMTAFMAFIFAPGYVTLDSNVQYQEALGRWTVTNWHAPLMVILWKLVLPLSGKTPLSLYVLILFIFYLGLFSIFFTILQQRTVAIFFVLAISFFPSIMPLLTVVKKETLMLALFVTYIAGVIQIQNTHNRQHIFYYGLALFLLLAGFINCRTDAFIAAWVLAYWPLASMRQIVIIKKIGMSFMIVALALILNYSLECFFKVKDFAPYMQAPVHDLAVISIVTQQPLLLPYVKGYKELTGASRVVFEKEYMRYLQSAYIENRFFFVDKVFILQPPQYSLSVFEERHLRSWGTSIRLLSLWLQTVTKNSTIVITRHYFLWSQLMYSVWLPNMQNEQNVLLERPSSLFTAGISVTQTKQIHLVDKYFLFFSKQFFRMINYFWVSWVLIGLILGHACFKRRPLSVIQQNVLYLLSIGILYIVFKFFTLTCPLARYGELIYVSTILGLSMWLSSLLIKE